MSSFHFRAALRLVLLLAPWTMPFAAVSSRAAVVINELSAAPSERQLSWSSNGVPRLGSGVAWMEPDFIERGWSSGLLPAGYGFGGLSTDLTATMKDKTPSLYLRKEFTLTASQAAFTGPLLLTVEYNDGFVAYVNGREVSRANAGASNHFLYASQPAFNVSTSAAPVEIDLGPANALLVPGRNVLAIQARNAEQPSTTNDPTRIVSHLPTPEFKIDAGLRASGVTVVSLRTSTFDFNDAAGAVRVHANTNGVITDTLTGTPAPGGWLATAALPTSSPLWQGLRMSVEESSDAGAGGGGGLRFTLDQSGANQPASIRAPAVNLAGGWTPGNVTATDLANTLLRFRARAEGGAQFRLRLEPAPGQEASALTDFPLIAPANDPAITFATASGGTRVMTINGAGGQSQSQIGSLISLSLFAFASNDVRNMTYRIVEDATVGAGYNGSKGHLRAEITQAATAGTFWGFSYGGITVSNWTAGNVSTQDFAYAGFQFACKLPAGVTFEVWAEPGSGGYSNRVDWGTLTGDGNWQIVQRNFAGLPNAENFRLALNAASTRAFKLLFRASASLGLGTVLQLDDLQLAPWRQYSVQLSSATNGQSAFLSWLNSHNSVSFVPAFEKFSDASTNTQTLTLDDYEVIYTGANASSLTNFVLFGPAGGAWDYFVGRAEPSGGVFDPGLLATNFPPPAGEEGDFESPADFVDWIELFNDGAAPVNLSGWSLTDQKSDPGKWRFPTNTTLASGSYLLVLCDGREEANVPAGSATYLHAGFSLSGDGEYVALYDNSGVFVDGITSGYPKQVFFASYGRNPTNPLQFGYLTTATPGTNNFGAFLPNRVDSPSFKRTDGTNDLLGGLYLSAPSLALVLTNAMPGSAIRYTLDGSEPTEGNGLNYSAPLTLTQPLEKTGVVVRARAFLPGWLPSGVKTHTYLLRQPAALTNVPALLFTGQKERSFYKPFGILGINGGTFQAANGGGEVWLANGPQSYNEVLGNGAPFEREVHMEYFFPSSYYPTNQQAIREDIGLRVSSSPYQRARMKLANVEVNSPWQPWWDVTEKPSFNVYFNGDYGISKLDYRIFPGYDVKDFQHLRLRAGKNDSGNPFITDELVRRLWIDMGQAGSRGLFCSLYLDGVYKGVFNLCERLREPFFQEHHRSNLDWDVRYNYDWVNGDGVAYAAMFTALNRDLAVLSNYTTVTALLDEDNFADYYLLNIYCAMWDWPENNFVFARERSTGPLGRFTYAVWDAEGAFNVNSYYAKPASFDTLAELSSKNVDVPNIWKRLVLSPEFRLRFADRVNKHLFNGGVLDDRDPDGGGPSVSLFQQRFNELAAEAAPLVLYNHGAPLLTNLFTSWTTPLTGRRSYLLGNTGGRQMLRDAGLWPVTEPPIFSQHGGAVPPGYGLTMTSVVVTAGQSATIYFTLDGSDPRLTGGVLKAGSLTYTGAVALTNIVTVKARARNSSTGEWSALTEATFAPSAVPASGANLVIAEIMYHPPDATSNELANGFNNADDFEFLRLLNIGASPVDLSSVRFTTGITFDFGAGLVRYANPGASVLVVKNRTAFRLRYGMSLDMLIAGEYGGNLSNGGERLVLLAGATALRDFSYSDGGAWPESPDGDGPSLLLRDPFGNPDHAQGTNWIPSAIPGGMPGGFVPVLTFDAWRALLWSPSDLTNAAVSGPDADPDFDGIVNFAEYALGLHPTRGQPSKRPQAFLETVGANRFLALRYNVSAAAVGATISFQVSSNLLDWTDGLPSGELLLLSPNLDGTSTWKFRDNTPVESTPYRFIRLRVSGP